MPIKRQIGAPKMQLRLGEENESVNWIPDFRGNKLTQEGKTNGDCSNESKVARSFGKLS
jgi:hypothetical protein